MKNKRVGDQSEKCREKQNFGIFLPNKVEKTIQVESSSRGLKAALIKDGKPVQLM